MIRPTRLISNEEHSGVPQVMGGSRKCFVQYSPSETKYCKIAAECLAVSVKKSTFAGKIVRQVWK